MGIVLGASLLILPIPALSAPSLDDDPPMRNSGLVSIPQVAGRGYTLSASLVTTYNSNLLRNPVTGNNGAGYRIAPDVVAGIGVPVGRQQIFVGGSLGRDFFIGNERLNNNRVRFGGGVNLRAGTRCDGSVAGEVFRRQNLLGDVAQIQDNVQQTRTAGATINCQGPVGMGFGGTVQYLDTENARVQRSLFNFNSLSFSPQISYASPVIGVFSVSANFQEIKYPQRQVVGLEGPVNDGMAVRSLRAGFRRNLGSRLDLALGVSQVRVTPKPDTVLLLIPDLEPGGEGNFVVFVDDRQPFTTMGYDGSLSMQLGERARITASTSRSAVPNANLGTLTAVRTAHDLDIDYTLGRGLSAGVGGTISNATYRGSFASVDEPFLRVSDKIERYFARVNYAPRNRISIGLEVSHQKRTSDPAFLSFSNTVALLRLRYTMGRST